MTRKLLFEDKVKMYCSTCKVSYLKGVHSFKEIFDEYKLIKSQCKRGGCRPYHYPPFQYQTKFK